MRQGKGAGVIVLLEDDDLDGELITERLDAEGFPFEVRRAADAPTYLKLLKDPNVLLVLSDFSLPAYDGWTALEAARRSVPNAPFIFISGAIGEELAIDTLRKGATDYVLKHRLERLGPAVRRALTEAETRRLRAQAERERDALLVSERAARHAAEAASRMKDEFLAVVSHELRTPLQAVIGWATLLTAKPPQPEMTERGLATILRNAQVQCRLIDDILDISRITRGKLQLHLSTVEAVDFILAAVEAVRPAADAKGIKIHLHLEALGQICADAERMQQVVWNLMANAVKFTESGGVIRLTATRDAGRLRIEVADTGVGIEPELLPHVFQRFRQGDGSKTRAYGGLGLGLAIVRHLAEMHGGGVAAVSEGLGKGATFTLSVPLQAAVQTPQPLDYAGSTEQARVEVGEVTPLLAGVRVLLVDDEPDARSLASEVLSLSGAEVATAGSVVDALETFTTFRPDVLVSDIGMPHEDGYSLLRQLRDLGPSFGGDTPAIALTAYARDIDRKDSASVGYQRHLAKPVTPEVLVGAVAAVLDRPRA